jgi:predicted transposase YbfD/YdcC
MTNSTKKTPEYSTVFTSYFSSLKDPRRTNKGNFYYPLQEILFLTISAVISGADGWVSISQFGESKLSWLRKYYPYENGIPSHDVLGKLFARLNHKEFTRCFTNWIASISHFTNGEVVAVDGKSIRKSNDQSTGESALHVVSAYAAENRLCLGQQVVGQKSNEITAIPELLKILDIKGCIVTIDAMGCQKKIAADIVKKKADYLLMVKDNQKELKQQVEKMFIRGAIKDTNKQIDAGHGRVENRVCDVIDELCFMDEKEQWKNLKSIVMIQSERCNKQTGETSKQTRYYISSLPADAEKMNKAIRQHWSIENNLHWELDVIFKEDDSLKKKGESPKNFNVILKMAMTLLNNKKLGKLSKPTKRLKAALDDKFRTKILKG